MNSDLTAYTILTEKPTFTKAFKYGEKLSKIIKNACPDKNFSAFVREAVFEKAIKEIN